MATPEQLGIAYKNAVAAGDTAAANEIAQALNKVASAGTDYSAPVEPSRQKAVAQKVGSDAMQFIGSLGREAMEQWVKPGVRALRRDPLGLPTPDSVSATKELGQNLEPSVRMAPMLLNADPRFRAASQATQAAISGLGFAAGEGLAGGDAREQAAAGLLGAAGSFTPGFTPSAGEFARKGQYVVSAALGAGLQGGAEVGANLIRGKDLKESVSSAGIPALVGGVFGGGGQLGRAFEKYAEEAAAARRAFGGDVPLALRSPTMFGSVAAKAERAGTDIGIEALERRVGSDFIGRIGDQIDGAEVVSRLSPYVGKLDAGTAELAKMSRNSLEATENLKMHEAALAESNANAATDFQGKHAGLVAKLKDASNKAALAYAKDIADRAQSLQELRLSGNYVSPADTRAFFVDNVMTKLDEAVKAKASALQAAIKIPLETQFIPGKSIASAFDDPSSAIRSDKLKAIANKYLTIPAGGGERAYRTLSRGDIQALRSDLNAMQDSEDIATNLDTAVFQKIDKRIRETMRESIEEFSPDSIPALDEFNAYWAAKSDALSNKHARALFKKDPADTAVTGMVNNIVENGAGSQSYTGLIKYIGAAADGNPVLQREMKLHVFGLIRDNIVSRNYGAGSAVARDVVDLNKLSGDLTRLRQGRFPVAELGLNEEVIHSAAKLSKVQGMHGQISGKEFVSIMENPAVKLAIQGGENPTPIVKRVMSELSAVRAHREAKWNEIAGKTTTARRNYQVAATKAKDAGKDLAAIDASVGDMQKDPLFVAFSGKKNFGLTGEGQESFEQFLNYISDTSRTRGEDVASLLDAVQKKSPEMREQIAIHTLARTVEFLSKNQLTGERGIDWASVGKFIDPENPVAGRLAQSRIRTIVGEDAFGRLMENMPRLEIVRQFNKQREAVGVSARNITEAGTAAKGISTGKSGTGQGVTLRVMSDLAARGEYGLAAWVLAIPGADKALKAGASMNEIVQALGPQRAYIMMQNMPQNGKEGR